MNCKEFDIYIMDFITDDDFDEELGKEFENHYMNCDVCWKKYQVQLHAMSILQEKGVAGILGEELELKTDDKKVLKLFINGVLTDGYKIEDNKLIIQLYKDFQIEPVAIYIDIAGKEYFYKEFGKEELGVFRDAAKTDNIVQVDFGIKKAKEKYKGIIDYELIIDSDKGYAELIVNIEF